MSKVFNFSANRKNDNKKVNARSHQLKIYSIGSVLLFLAIILLMNVILDKALGKKLSFDFSVEHSNTISNESVKFIESIPQGTRIRIVGLFENPESITGTRYQYIIPILNDYVKKSDGKITLEFVDVKMNPTIISELDPTGSYNLSKMSGQFVVSYNGKLDVIDPISCYTIDSEYLESHNAILATGINTEYTFTNSMMSLIKGYASKAYIVSGLKESKSENLKRILKSVGVETADLPVSSGFAIPEDCNLLILNGPNTDITEKMYVQIKSYLEKGGKVIVSVEYSAENVNESFKNLNHLLNEMNINIEQCMVSENNPSYQLDGMINDSLADVAKGFSDFASDKRMHITLARPLGSVGVNNQNIVVAPVLMTSSNANKSVADENNQAKMLEGEAGVINVGMYAAYTESSGEIFVFGTTNFTSDDYFSEFSVNDRNADFIKSCVRSMLRSSAIYNINIPVIKIDSFQLDESKATTSMSTGIMVIFMIILPLILSSMAVIVYNKRKNL